MNRQRYGVLPDDESSPGHEVPMCPCVLNRRIRPHVVVRPEYGADSRGAKLLFSRIVLYRWIAASKLPSISI